MLKDVGVDEAKLNAEIKAHRVNKGVYKKAGSCSMFFDEEKEAYVRARNSRYFDLLGYPGCCSERPG